MFNTDRLSQLSEFEDHVDDIIRDGAFYAVGKAETYCEKMLIPLWNAAYVKAAVARPEIAAIICTPEIAPSIPDHLALALSSNPKAATIEISRALAARPGHFWDDFESIIPDSCDIHPTATIAPKNVRLGERCKIMANAVIEEQSIIGDDVYIGQGVVIACLAFETFVENGKHVVMPQVGAVRIGNRAAIFANSCVAKSSYASAWTIIGEDCIIDNLVQIGHDVNVGDRTRIGASAEISGRVQIGADCYIAPTAKTINGIRIGDRAYVTMGSLVTEDVADGQRVTGYFAEPHHMFLKRLMLSRRKK